MTKHLPLRYRGDLKMKGRSLSSDSKLALNVPCHKASVPYEGEENYNNISTIEAAPTRSRGP
jgi:hypothetical protein